jgi:glycosyltransferase involved in cell wall biosynthesis
MKVAQFIIGSHGGAERFYVKLLTALRDYGVEQHAIHNSDPRLTEAVAEAGVPTTVIDFAKGLDRAGRRHYREALARIKPDVVVHWMNRAARRAELGPHINVGRLGGFYPVRYYWRCDHLIANTPQIYADIISQGWPAHAAQMLSNFGELEPRPAATRASLGVGEDAFLLLAMGRFDPWKCFDVLISAMKHLPPRAVLCLAGDGERMEQFRAHAAGEGVADRIRFLGWRSDQAALLGACDLCVVPSAHEPLADRAWRDGAAVREAERWGSCRQDRAGDGEPRSARSSRRQGPCEMGAKLLARGDLPAVCRFLRCDQGPPRRALDGRPHEPHAEGLRPAISRAPLAERRPAHPRRAAVNVAGKARAGAVAPQRSSSPRR